MDVLFGMVGDGFVLLVSDTSRVQSIVVQRTAVDKIVQLDSHKLMARCPRRAALLLPHARGLTARRTDARDRRRPASRATRTTFRSS
jgi:hypothetical protein